ncbi:NHLP family bacteriocin export ABC transporter peptidase/permease/ATPase subunit [Reyranella sp.]|uniref:NHLP family bacteriocin export ABC transporter peptidase/permease/ATPase subunit n=1 Tax=Reyranella sp. TaxID=1929291 RepID=UPI003BA84552
MTARSLGRGRRVRTPTILQMERLECGAAALGIVLAHFGRRVPLEELRVVCGVSRDGSRAGSVVRAARSYGLEARGYRRELDEVLAGPFPVIVFWNFKHFVVVEGVARNKVYLNDPALGPRTVSLKEFDESFTGVVLDFRPGPDFKPGGTKDGLLGRLAGRLRGFEPAVAFVAWMGLMLAIPGLVLPGMTQILVDDILVRHFDDWLGPLLIGLAVTFALNVLLTSLQQLALLRIELRLALEQSALFVWHLLRLPVEFFGQRFSGDLVSRVESNDRVATLLAGDIGTAAANCLTATMLGIAMMFYDVTLAAIAIAGAVINVVALRLVSRPLRDVALRLQTEVGKIYSESIIGLQSIETLKATGGEGDFFGKWAGHHARIVNAEQRLTAYQQATNLVPSIVASLTAAAILGVGALLVIDGAMSVGTLVAFQGLLISFSLPVQQMVAVAGKIQQAAADLARLDDVLRYRRDWRFPETPRPPLAARAAGRLTMEKVSFGYTPLQPPLIENFALTVEPGQWVALVGDSGSGKSTLGQLVTGLREPRSGEVRIDGHTLADWGRDNLSRLVASVDQDIHLFQGTLRENITMWDATIPQARVLAAIDDVGLTGTVQSLPGNVDAAIEEDGRNLNGGQRQRVEIARALVQEPAVLVLDEATSALDTISENAILQAVRRRGMTCILVAHRLSTIRDCDEIIVMEHGKVVERGRHAELVAAGGPYSRLISIEEAK